MNPTWRALAVLLLCAAPASAIERYGSLRAMMHQGQIEATVSLEKIAGVPDMYALGALSELRGEILVLAGEAWLSYPEAGNEIRVEHSEKSDDSATLLVTARVESWNRIEVEAAIPFAEIDDYIGELAQSEAAFPFLLEGVFEDVSWHVIDGTRLDEGASHEEHRESAAQGELERAFGRILGFYSTGDQGVFTHMGSRTHMHLVTADGKVAGHVDRVRIPKGATLSLPRR